jgi:predicted negative regulator of RcsB-dependent stress response
MAIEFNCPHCKTHYRLKDEFGGKTATCKNPDCRKIIPIPKSGGRFLASAPADLDAIAAAAFADEAAKADKPAEQMIPVTCTGCDYAWTVEASKEGKNVRCPECGKVVRVPVRKKEEKADWRTGGGGPSLAKRETGLDREGAFGTAHMGGISEGTAREIVKSREDEEEPEERRRKFIKRGLISLLVLAVIGAAAYFGFKTRKEMKTEANMAEAVKEQNDQGVKDAHGVKDPRFEAIMVRASAEYKCRTASSAEEAAEALNEVKRSRNTLKQAHGAKGPSADASGLLAEAALTMPQLLGSTAEVDKGIRHKSSDVAREMRQTLELITDPDLVAETVRAATRECARKGHPTLLETVANQRADKEELDSQIALELLRLDPNKYRGDAEALLGKLGTTDTPGAQALRTALGKPLPAKKKDENPAPSPAATAEAEAIKGNTAAAAKAARSVSGAAEKAKALATVGQTMLQSSSGEAGPVLVDASKTLKGAQGVVSPWVSIRVCRLLGRAGQFEEAESLAASLPDDQTKAWARLEALRGRLEAAKDKKADDAWLDPIGDPTKLAAAAKAREAIARHNAAAGFGGDYQGVVKRWPAGTVRPFGMAGIVLGQLDRDRPNE